jgi:sugar-specific transcriptional regulator TrmB
MDDELINQLADLLGEMELSAYEAKAYAALLGEKQPVTRYVLARISGVPSPKIYGVVQKLYEKGYVTQTVGEVPLIAPIDPYIVLERIRQKQERALENLYQVLEDTELTRQKEEGHIWNLAGVESAFAKANEIIERSQFSIYMAVFGQDLMPLLPGIRVAEERGVRVRILSYGSPLARAGEIAEHGDVEGIIDRTGGRWFALVSDQREVLVSYPLERSCESVWTNSPVLSLMISKYVDEHFFRDRPISYETRDESVNGQNRTGR